MVFIRQIVHAKMTEFQPPPFVPHPVCRGGHLQTIASIGTTDFAELRPKRHIVPVSEGDAIVLHEDRPASWRPGRGAMLLVHGLSGCHAAPYMRRIAHQFLRDGICVFRMDMRGCGAASPLATNLTHAGRSDDLVRAIEAMAIHTQSGPLGAIGVSLGASQLLRAFGRIGAGLDATPSWLHRLDRIAAVAPPIDLQRCSDNLQRWVLRPYNYYFIRALLSRVPERVRNREDFQLRISGSRPKTLRELDDRITAPLSGFADAVDYYRQSSADRVTRHNPVSTLVLAAADDPLVPVGCFLDDRSQWPESTRLEITKTGGHVGFVDRQKRSWMDRLMQAWFASCF
jgi:predicted alpha/beta-fold hydrolase